MHASDFLKKSETVSYAKVTSIQNTEVGKDLKCTESRMNSTLKIFIDISFKESNKILETIVALSNLLVNFLVNVSKDSPKRRKHPNKGDGPHSKKLSYIYLFLDAARCNLPRFI